MHDGDQESQKNNDAAGEAGRRYVDIAVQSQRRGEHPRQWARSNAVTLPKSGCRGEPKRHRLINLICGFGKTFWTVMATVGNHTWDDQRDGYQSGFTKLATTTDGIALNLTSWWRAQRQGLSAALLCDDIEGAFDMTSRSDTGGMFTTWSKDVDNGEMSKTIEALLHDLMRNTSLNLDIPVAKTAGGRYYLVKTGIRQGDGTGPKIFRREFHEILERWRKAIAADPQITPWCVRYGHKSVDISHGAFADDTWRLYVSWYGSDLHVQVERGREAYRMALAPHDLKLHDQKGVCMVRYRGPKAVQETLDRIPTWEWGEPVLDTRLLGTEISVTSGNRAEISSRISKFRKSCCTFARFFSSRRISHAWKCLVYKAVCVNTLFYSLEARNLSAWELRRLDMRQAFGTA